MKFLQTKSLIKEAVQKLKAGEIVALPTETVYGLAVDAHQLDAVQKLYLVKQRQENKPFTIAVANPDDINCWVHHINDDAQLLINSFWPGPLTLILPALSSVPRVINAGKTNIGLRCSSCPVINEIISLLGNAICLTSANVSGEKEATLAADIISRFKNKVYVFAGDDYVSGISSTVIDLTTNPYRVLRETAVSFKCIQNLLQEKVMR